MATYYNRLTLCGNRTVERLNSEINYRLIDDDKEHGLDNPLSIYRIFYGLSAAQARGVQKLDDITEVYYSNDTQYRPSSSGFTLVSKPKPLFDLQDHILMYASTLDKQLIVCNKAYTMPLSSCTVRYVVLDKNKIREFSATRPLKEPKNQTLETDKLIDSAMDEIKKEAFEKLMNGVKWVREDMFRW
ncbi:hypothetical protein [Mesorhizobium japonicum]|uniref:hypothetical protein n=1 Tax=Mesorhizobium japonicum TaxID=2066070 RepID=UPI003B5CD95C